MAKIENGRDRNRYAYDLQISLGSKTSFKNMTYFITHEESWRRRIWPGNREMWMKHRHGDYLLRNWWTLILENILLIFFPAQNCKQLPRIRRQVGFLQVKSLANKLCTRQKKLFFNTLRPDFTVLQILLILTVFSQVLYELLTLGTSETALNL